MENADYKLTRGGYDDPFWRIIPFEKDKYIDGSLVIQSWYHPNNVPKDSLEEEGSKKSAAISGSAATDASGKKTATVSGSSASTVSNAGVTTIHGKAEKQGD